MASVSKRQVLLIRCDELVACVICCVAATTQLVVAESIELFAVRIKGRVTVNSVGWHFNNDAWRDVLSVGEGDAFKHATTE